MIKVTKMTGQEPGLAYDLAILLQDAAQAGASIGFLRPLAFSKALAYGRGVCRDLGPHLHLWTAVGDKGVAGTVQLELSRKENGQHRGEIQKLLVHSASRRLGIASSLMAAAETFAWQQGRMLLVLDTEAGSLAEFLYQHLGWTRACEIPSFAATPDGILKPTVFYFKMAGSLIDS